MGFLQLFYVASVPVIKVLLISVLGLLLALDRLDILGETARKHVNHMVFYVFNPAMVSDNLAKTITWESFASLWFMPVNVLATFLIGSALGWVLIKLTRPPKHSEGLIMGCCAAGNLGNLPIVIIPAICKEKGSPFGDPDVCHKYGMAYASLSMALGSVFLWSYVYNIMRNSASKFHREGNADDDISKLKASGENPESLPNECSETLDPSKDAMDDAYTLLLPDAESVENKKIPISEKIKSHLTKISRSVNWKAMFAPSTIAAIAGFVIGLIPQIRNILVGSDAPLRVVENSASMLGDAAIPTVTIILGANLYRGLKGTSIMWSTTVGIIAVRYIFLPIMGALVVKGAIKIGLVNSDPLYQFVLLLQYALPPAMNIGTMSQLFGGTESECSVIMLWTYALASVAVTLWSTYFMWFVSS
ncbi:protein PIN-LIKES 3-like [Neltuma alba]|uniref:protein PIN-LIKES 3-like n=1 Tax=Neltuma alba TaxID=207710 RepID=UPI0010A5032C|nr:protein PIN-LIKES 3-like [Prosopis alba]XP_028776755.1 protein PIN-LIKES 3-like [Prosopis alba]XP_028776756.1 protein PIN-LIKES 3-like [Prosopis alba]XP_028782946.1 protein PIN-LIKES 3-like [Prosopis alba]XP_028782947.1 protein PIN-LIKES 3-like [Prosopis alba]XP_028782950.1 protein PIN-LIKES 3-like [Prosopis alba]XP_028782951.1 protein PIN-LIKES 3-like [Prosopis alba]XP_028782953.1 protein PIN-LIKES 3-like [Prosopis alba]